MFLCMDLQQAQTVAWTKGLDEWDCASTASIGRIVSDTDNKIETREWTMCGAPGSAEGACCKERQRKWAMCRHRLFDTVRLPEGVGKPFGSTASIERDMESKTRRRRE